jgi:hypothetical protein
LSANKRSLAQRIGFAAGHGQQGVAAQLVVIVEVFVAQRQPCDALSQQLLELMIHKARIALILETFSQRTRHSQTMVSLTQ